KEEAERCARQQQRLPSAYLFPAERRDGPLSELKSTWRRVVKAAQLEDVRVHDLRHTYATLLASSGASLPTIGALLGHTQPRTTQRYAHLFDDPQREATGRAGAIVMAAGNQYGDAVIPLPHPRPGPRGAPAGRR
ncbi:MAG TPA: tyrosine-type recombinase/integrase, partial [Stellaceae bacterium]|nr:tyrosine-type recombinase/integrase [Stellaceae bacterium]